MFAFYTCVSSLSRVASSVINTTVTLISSNVTSELYNVTVTCTIHPDSMANQCEVRARNDGGVTKTGTYMYICAYTVYYIAKGLNDGCTIV